MSQKSLFAFFKSPKAKKENTAAGGGEHNHAPGTGLTYLLTKLTIHALLCQTFKDFPNVQYLILDLDNGKVKVCKSQGPMGITSITL